VEAVLGRTPVLLASLKTSKGLSTVAQVVSWVVARAASAVEGMTVGCTIPSLKVAVAVVELADLVCPRQTLDVPTVGLSRLFHQIYVNWTTAARATAAGRVCDDKMGVWEGQHSQSWVLCGTPVQGALEVQEEWGVDSAGPGGVLHRRYVEAPGFVRMV
jgi:hypothetical protein